MLIKVLRGAHPHQANRQLCPPLEFLSPVAAGWETYANDYIHMPGRVTVEMSLSQSCDAGTLRCAVANRTVTIMRCGVWPAPAGNEVRRSALGWEVVLFSVVQTF